MTAPFTPIRDGTLSALLRTLATQRGDAEALVYPAFAHGGRAIRRSFGEVDRYVDELAKGLMAIGVERGEHVVLWAPNVPDWVALEFALARIGAVLVTANTALKGEEIAYLIGQSGARSVLHSTRTGTNEASAILDELFERGDASVAGVERRVWLPAGPDAAAPEGERPGDHRGPLTSIADVIRTGAAVDDDTLATREAACTTDDVVNIQYTSGTTGFPKGVMLSHRNILANGFALGDQMRTGPDDRVALQVPLFHCFGCVVCVLGAFSHGATLCCVQAFDPRDVLELIESERISVLSGVPTMYNALIQHPDRSSRDLSTLRTGIAAGAPCPVPLMREIDEVLGCTGIGVAYGLTEASPGVSGSRPEDDFEQRCHTVGRPLPGTRVQISDPATDAPLPDGEAGEVRLAGYNVMVGYHDDPDATAAAITADGWLRTGDLGLIDERGCLRIVGRIKDIIIRGGENIAPAEIESLLREHEDVVDAAVVGVPHDHFGEEVAAAMILRAGATLDGDALASFLDDRIAGFKIPKVWKQFDAFPLTGSGKVRKFQLREMF